MEEYLVEESSNALQANMEALEKYLAEGMETSEEMPKEEIQSLEVTKTEEEILLEIKEVLLEIKEIHKANLYINTALLGVLISSLAIITLLRGIFK